MRLTDEDIQRHKNNEYDVMCTKGIIKASDGNIIQNLIDTIEALQRENKQLRAQVARMKEALEQFKYDYEQNCPIYQDYLAVCQLLREDAGTNYHNPADVEALKK